MSSYWHGGVPGLKPGDLIRPATDDRHLVDGCPTCEARRRGKQLPNDPSDPSRIYVTTERDYAKVFAAGYPRGALYRVEPIGDLEPSGDDPAPSWAVGSARVLSVYDPLVNLTPARMASLVRRWMR